MSEQLKQDPNSQANEIEDDPLAELARIVAGEPELNPPENVGVNEAAVSVSDEVVQDDIDDAALDVSVEAALEEQLMQEISTPSFVDDINASVEAMASESTEVEIPQAQESDIPSTPPQVDQEGGFQDDLISALESELVSDEPAADTDATGTMVATEITDIPAVEDAQQEVLQVPDMHVADTEEVAEQTDTLVDDADMQKSLEQELSEQFSMEVEEPESEDNTAIAAAGVAATASAAVAVAASTSSIEDDLGAAFANEFEQMTAETPEEQVTEAVVEESVIQGDPELEIDFASAFAQEIEVANIPVANVSETQGWQENSTLEANETFVEAASPEILPNVETQLIDPGHAGTIDEVSQVEETPIAANNNGGGLKYAVAALVIALFAGTIAVGYNFLGGSDGIIASGTPKIIKAATDPVKVKPKDPGGQIPENQDNASYVDLGGGNSAAVSQKTLVSKTEAPAILNTQPAVDPVKTDDRLASSQDEGATPNAPKPSVLPKVVQTLVVKPDGTIIRQPSVSKPLELASNSVTIGDAATVNVQPVTTQVIKKPEATASIDGANTTGNISIPTANPAPKPVVKAPPKPKPVKQAAATPKPKKATPAPARKSEWVVQVSSQRSPEAAQSSFNNMRNRFSALQGRAMSIQRANVNGTTYFRVRVQTASRADANQLCNRLASAGGNCFVTR